nr:gustatory and odorant receptor 24 [Leptinotarsa decemlineata]
MIMNSDNFNISLIEGIPRNNSRRRSVYLEGTQPFYQKSGKNPNPVIKVAPYDPSGPGGPVRAFHDSRELDSVFFNSIKPMVYLLKAVGIFPIGNTGCVFQTTPQLLIYSIAVFVVIFAYICYIRWDKVEMVRSAEGRFEEAVIDYLFTVYLVPIVINPIAWYEAKKQARVLTNLVAFEKLYQKVTKNKFPLLLGNKSLIIAIGLPVLATVTMVVTHLTMVHFKFLQVVPYCYINMITYLVGGAWYLYCDLLGNIALTVAKDFKQTLKNIGPSSRIADYRSLWMMLSRLIRDVGNAFGYTVTFLCLYLFLIITLTIYGLMSQMQEGLGIKDVGLTITAVFATATLFFICDEAHYGSNCVKVQFQKRLLLVELNWMNDDAQQEINMFLRATEMNPTDMSLGGFFDVNRNLFKSLIATMVTYLVVLLQFQISIPEDGSASGSASSNDNNSTKILR